jgi:hypothetical protein
MDWESLFSGSAMSLRAALMSARAAVEHRGVKGNLNEQVFADWIEPLLPGAVGVCTGEVVDSLGGRSRQVDVLLYSKATTPQFLSRGDTKVLPVEPVYASIEVKTHLNKQEIEASFENMRALKSLRKLAFHEMHQYSFSLYGTHTYYWPLQFFIFAYESDSLETVLGHISRLNEGQPIDQRIDMVCVLDKGLIVNVSNAGLQAIPMPDSKLIAKESSKPLLTFYALIAHMMGQAVCSPVAMHPYLAHISH